MEQQEPRSYDEGPARRDPDDMLDDERTIKSAHYERGGGYEVGEDGVTEIVAYGEKGQGAYVPFIAVYKGSEIATRVPAHKFASINYHVPYDDQPEEDTDDEWPDVDDDDIPW